MTAATLCVRAKPPIHTLHSPARHHVDGPSCQPLMSPQTSSKRPADIMRFPSAQRLTSAQHSSWRALSSRITSGFRKARLGQRVLAQVRSASGSQGDTGMRAQVIISRQRNVERVLTATRIGDEGAVRIMGPGTDLPNGEARLAAVLDTGLGLYCYKPFT